MSNGPYVVDDGTNILGTYDTEKEAREAVEELFKQGGHSLFITDESTGNFDEIDEEGDL